MEDWKYDLYLRILAKDKKAFDAPTCPPMNRNERNCYKRMAKNYRDVDGKLLQGIKRNELAQFPLKPMDEISLEPKLGVDFEIRKVVKLHWLPVVRLRDRHAWLLKCHDENGHQGRDACLKVLESQVHWYGMKNDVCEHIQKCDLCQKTRTDYSVAPLQHILPEKPFVRWQIDFTTIAGHDGYLLIVIDCFTKFVWWKWLPTKEAAGVTAFLLKIMKRESARPRIIQSDNGGEFISEAMNQIAAEFGIEIIHGRPYHPQSQGNVERVNKTLKSMLYKLIRAAKQQNQSYSLVSLIEDVVDTYNSSSHSSTGFTPVELQRPLIQSPTRAQTPSEILADQRLQLAGLFARAHKNLEKAANKADQVHNKKHKSKLRIFEVGDRVLYKIPKQLRRKGQALYDCEAEVITVHRNNRYSLKFITNEPPNSDRTFHANEFKKYYDGAEQNTPVTSEQEHGPNNNSDANSDLFEFNDVDEELEEAEIDDDMVPEEEIFELDAELDANIELLISTTENNTNVICESTSSVEPSSDNSVPDFVSYSPRQRTSIPRAPGQSECNLFRQISKK